jgi:hypothetical protein
VAFVLIKGDREKLSTLVGEETECEQVAAPFSSACKAKSPAKPQWLKVQSFRMLNDDVIDLYGRAQVGTKVVVLPIERRHFAQSAFTH